MRRDGSNASYAAKDASVARSRGETRVLIPAKVDYGMRALLALAAAGQSSLNVEYIAEAQGIPLQYLAVIMARLARAEIVRGQRGPEGGYCLAREPQQITLADVARALDKHLVDAERRHHQDVVYAGAAEHLQEVWTAVGAELRNVFDSISLADVLSGTISISPGDLAGSLGTRRAK
jgi:Rrf2 family protein